MTCLFCRRSAPAIFTAMVLGALALYLANPDARSHGQAKTGKGADVDLGAKVAALQKVVDRLKQGAPDQAHAMMSVAYNFDNLWFAGQHGNWPLAHFYLGETKSHLRWAVRIIPIRKDSAGREIKLTDILQSLENSAFKQLEEAIKTKNRDGFVASYRFTLEGCYACHKAAEKPYLRLRVPMRPHEPMIDFEPPPAVKKTPK